MLRTESELSALPNLGKTLTDKLKLAGIDSPENLRQVGSEKAFLKLSTIDKHACLNMLYALEGAIQGIRWHNLSQERKSELKLFYNMTTR